MRNSAMIMPFKINLSNSVNLLTANCIMSGENRECNVFTHKKH